MAHHLDSGATMACIIPPGVLFIEGAEGHIRRYLIEDCNWIDTVLGLPEKIFYGTGIPTCIHERTSYPLAQVWNGPVDLDT